MSARGRSTTAWLAMALAVLAWGPGAEAQEAIDRSFVAEEGAQGYMFPGAVPALRGFDIGYTRSDHQIRRVILGPLATSGPPSAGDYLIALRDRDGSDAISGSVKLTDVRRLGRLLHDFRALTIRMVRDGPGSTDPAGIGERGTERHEPILTAPIRRGGVAVRPRA
jgi:hypothetical protein